jgi:hypothetical protein
VLGAEPEPPKVVCQSVAITQSVTKSEPHAVTQSVTIPLVQERVESGRL